MNKSYVITFSVCFIVLLSVAVVLLMITLPENIGVLEGNTEEYDGISKDSYTYKSTKNITTEIIEKDYIVTGDQMTDYERNYLYLPGNSDPFSPKVNQDNSSSNSSGNQNSSNKDTQQEATDKTTNSNGGVANPPSTNK